jgi:hypothetical protein
MIASDKIIQEIGVPQTDVLDFIAEMEAIRQEPLLYIKKEMSGHFLASRITDLKQTELSEELGIKRDQLDTTYVNLRENVQDFSNYTCRIIGQLSISETTSMQYAKCIELRENIDRAEDELEILYAEMEKATKVAEAIFLPKFENLYNEIESFLESFVIDSPSQIRKKLSFFLHEMDTITKVVEEKIEEKCPLIKTFGYEWFERRIAFGKESRHIVDAKIQLDKLSVSTTTKLTIPYHDALTGNDYEFKGSQEEIRKQLQWEEDSMTLIQQIQQLYTTIIEDGLIEMPNRLLFRQKFALENVIEKISLLLVSPFNRRILFKDLKRNETIFFEDKSFQLSFLEEFSVDNSLRQELYEKTTNHIQELKKDLEFLYEEIEKAIVFCEENKLVAREETKKAIEAEFPYITEFTSKWDPTNNAFIKKFSSLDEARKTWLNAKLFENKGITIELYDILEEGCYTLSGVLEEVNDELQWLENLSELVKGINLFAISVVYDTFYEPFRQSQSF